MGIATSGPNTGGSQFRVPRPVRAETGDVRLILRPVERQRHLCQIAFTAADGESAYHEQHSTLSGGLLHLTQTNALHNPP